MSLDAPMPLEAAEIRMTVMEARLVLAQNACWQTAEELIGKPCRGRPPIDLAKLQAASRIIAEHESVAPPGYVYILKDRNRVKIGYTIDIVQRVTVLRNQSGRPLRLIAALPSSFEDEGALHRRFAAYRGIGEWFLAEGELREFIRRPVRNLREALKR